MGTSNLTAAAVKSGPTSVRFESSLRALSNTAGKNPQHSTAPDSLILAAAGTSVFALSQCEAFFAIGQNSASGVPAFITTQQPKNTMPLSQTTMIPAIVLCALNFVAAENIRCDYSAETDVKNCDETHFLSGIQKAAGNNRQLSALYYGSGRSQRLPGRLNVVVHRELERMRPQT